MPRWKQWLYHAVGDYPSFHYRIRQSTKRAGSSEAIEAYKNDHAPRLAEVHTRVEREAEAAKVQRSLQGENLPENLVIVSTPEAIEDTLTTHAARLSEKGRKALTDYRTYLTQRAAEPADPGRAA